MLPIAERRAELAPDDHDALDQLGWIMWFTGHPERALPFLERSIAASPSSGWSRFFLGNASLALELFADAEVAYGKAVALKNLSSAQIGLICTLIAQDKVEEAAAQNAEFRASHDSDRYFVKAADCALLLGNREEARALAEQAAADSPEARYFPRGVLASTILGYVQWDDDRPAALRWLQQSEDIDRQRLADGDESAMTRYDLAAVDAVRGDRAAACAWLEAALEAGWRGARLAERDPLLTGLRGLAAFDAILEEARARSAASRRAAMLDS
jgi:tetratricopeptide (TPR) repeat protein